MKLVYREAQKEVCIGDVATTFRGEHVDVIDITAPHKSSSSGRVCIRDVGLISAEISWSV